MASFTMKWEAPEYEYREKTVSWYWTSIITAAVIIAFSVWQKNFLFGVFIVIAEILFIVWGNKAPKTLAFTVTDTGINVGGYKSYSMKEFESWSADADDTEWANVAFYFRSRLHPPLLLIVPEAKVAELRVNLKTILKEIEHQPTLVDSIEKFLRF